MRFVIFLTVTLLAVPAAVASPLVASSGKKLGCATLPTVSTSTAAAVEQLKSLGQAAARSSRAGFHGHGKSGICTAHNIAIRKEWGLLSITERIEYTNAVLCLQNKTANAPSNLVPGAKSRYDDWVATHINQTLTIHYTGTFLVWHRYFIWTYEQALRNECGYTGYQPYWDWSLSANDVEASPVFDGSATSMSGNGASVAGEAAIQLTLPPFPHIYLPPGTGGGCVTSGPFKDMKVNLGPVNLAVPGGDAVTSPNPFAYNPRCLKRDLTTSINQMFANASSIVDLIVQNNNIWDFQMTMQGVPGSGQIGVHGGGHYTLGGDPGRDVSVSPGDPAFYLHHGMIDRVWWVWQHLDPSNRINTISGTGTFLNQPPSPNTTLDTIIDLGYAANELFAMKDLMDTVAGPFCYIYE